MLIVDAHLDLGWNAIQWNRDLTQSVFTIRVQEAGVPGKGRATNTVALPEMRRGGVGLCFATLMGRSTGRPVHHVDFPSPAQTHGMAHSHMAYYRALAQMGEARIITDAAGLQAHVDEWLTAADTASLPVGFIISMESADAILDPSQVDEFYAAGVRAIGPAHFGTGRYVGGTGVEEGFTSDGLRLLDAMQSAGMVLDMTHLSDKAFWQAAERIDGRVIASHNNSRALVPHQRQFTDDQLKFVIEHDGVIGAALDCWMLKTGWIKDVTPRTGASLSDVVDHIDHICQLAGNAHHVGIGSDLDGGFGHEQTPHDLDTIADLPRIAELLHERGYSSDDIAAIMHGNWTRFLRDVLD